RQYGDYDRYVAEGTTLDQIETVREQYTHAPLNFFWHYHPQAFASYALALLACLVAIPWWRRGAYAGVRREAEKAIKSMGQAAQPVDASSAMLITCASRKEAPAVEPANPA